MADSADLSRHQDAAILALIRFLQDGLEGAPAYGGDTALVRSFLSLVQTYMSETRPTLTHALERAQKAPLPSEVLDELWAAGAKIDADCMASVRGIGELSAAGGTSAQMLRRSIAGVEHVSDAARVLTKRTDRLLEEFESGRSDRG
jgi:hypothetical protein